MPHKVTFEYDEPVVVHLMAIEGKAFDSGFPPFDLYWVFEAEEGLMFMSDTQGGLFAARLRARGFAVGDPVVVIKKKVPNPNSARPITEYVPYPWVPKEQSE